MEKRNSRFININKPVLILIILVGIFFYYKFILSVQLNDISKLKSEVENSETYLKKLNEIKNNKKDTLDKLSQMEKELEFLDRIIPNSKDTSEFNLQIYHVLKEQGFVDPIINPQSIKEVKGTSGFTCNYQEIEIEFSGSKQKVLEFLEYLKKMTRKVRICEAKFNIKSIEDINANLRIEVFFTEDKK